MTFADLDLLRIRLVSSCVNSSAAQSVRPGPTSWACVLSSAAPSGPVLSLLTFATCSGMALPALPSLLMRRVPIERAHFSSPTGDSPFSDDFFHSLSLRFDVSHVLARIWQMWCSLLLQRTQLLRSPSATSLLQVRTVSQSLIPLVASFFAFLLQPRSAPHCGSVRLEVQPRRPGHQARW